MRTTYNTAAVRLYHLDDTGEGGAVVTLFYGPMVDALAIAGAQDDGVQEGLYLATETDVVAYLDLE